MMSRSSGSWGRDRNRLVSHIRAASTLPRAMPAIAPTRVPTITAISMAARPTASEIRPPYSMRASMSWPRSSVPKGCDHEGLLSRAPKSISLIWTGHSSGPNRTPSTRIARISAPASARRWRRKRRHASAPGETGSARLAARGAALPVGDARIEPAIEDVGSEVAQDDKARQHERDRHDHRRVVGLDRADEQRPYARHPEDLLGHDRAAEDGRHLQED